MGAQIVAMALDEGGGLQYAPFLESHNVVWTPNDVRVYAQAVADLAPVKRSPSRY